MILKSQNIHFLSFNPGAINLQLFSKVSFRTFSTNSHSLPIKKYRLAITQLWIFKLDKFHTIQNLKKKNPLDSSSILGSYCFVRSLPLTKYMDGRDRQTVLLHDLPPLFLPNKRILSCTKDRCYSPMNFAPRQVKYLLKVFFQIEYDPQSNYWIIFFWSSTPKLYSL